MLFGNPVGGFVGVGGGAGEVVEVEIFHMSGFEGGAVIVGQAVGPDDNCA